MNGSNCPKINNIDKLESSSDKGTSLRAMIQERTLVTSANAKVFLQTTPTILPFWLKRKFPPANGVLNENKFELSIIIRWATFKRIADVIGSTCLIALLSPFLLVIGALIWAGGGPVIFGHSRIGRGGVWFKCYKFRTMVRDAEKILEKVLAEDPVLRAEWQRDEKLRKDPRITKIGEFLRRSSLDELPQLFNVLIGNMSLVGPRPVTAEGVLQYRKSLPVYLSVRPGMTGLWQVSGRNLVSFRRRVALDIYYVKNQSFFLDILILLRTLRAVTRGDGC